jgi:alpha-L-rhamnosidase
MTWCRPSGGGPGWSGFLVVMPWEVFRTYGDTRILASAYAAQKKLLRFWMRSRDAADGLVHDWSTTDSWTFLGDWAGPHGSEASGTPEALLFNNCYILYCTRLVARIARVLGVDEDAAAYERAAGALAAAIHAAFFVADAAAYLDTRQTHLVMPLVAGVPPPAQRPRVLAALRREIAEAQAAHLDTGLHGTYFLTKLLTDTSAGFGGDDALLSAVARETSPPGYGDLLAKGYTTWPEYWGTCAGDATPEAPYRCANWTRWVVV